MQLRKYRALAPMIGSLVIAAAFASPAAAVVLTNGSGEGQVSIDVTAAGAFRNAVYNPVGPTNAADTTFDSNVFFRIGTSGGRIDLSNSAASVSNQTATSLTSSFNSSGLSFTLLQEITDLMAGGDQAGSLLTQTYNFTNTTGGDLTFEFVRYLDGDLAFDGSINDGGGRLVRDGREILFETDTAIGSADADTFVGIYNDGGTSTGFEIDGYSGLLSRIAAGTALDNIVTGDGADADQFIDAGNGYDVTLGLGRRFTLAAGASASFSTATIFGTGAPDEIPVPSVPEPATWGMMILGFGMIGVSVRRRRNAGTRTFA